MIPDAAVEAVARRNYEAEWGDGWDGVIEQVKRGWLREARAQCEAAAPIIRAQALEDAAAMAGRPENRWWAEGQNRAKWLRLLASEERVTK